MYTQKEEEEKELDLGSHDPKALYPLAITSRVGLSQCLYLISRKEKRKRKGELGILKKVIVWIGLTWWFGLLWVMQVPCMLGDITVGQAYQFTQWLELVRKRSSNHCSSGFPHWPHRVDTMLLRLIVLFLLQCGLYVIWFGLLWSNCLIFWGFANKYSPIVIWGYWFEKLVLLRE